MATSVAKELAVGVCAYDSAARRTGVVQLLLDGSGTLTSTRAQQPSVRALLRPLSPSRGSLPWWASVRDLRPASPDR